MKENVRIGGLLGLRLSWFQVLFGWGHYNCTKKYRKNSKALSSNS